MSKGPTCPHCGYVGPEDARLCAHCGRSLIPLGARLAERIDSIFDRLAPPHIWVLGLVLLILIAVFSTHLIVWKLSFRFLIVVMALGIGGGMAYLGWVCSTPPYAATPVPPTAPATDRQSNPNGSPPVRAGPCVAVRSTAGALSPGPPPVTG